MGMDSVFRLSVVMGLIDELTNPLSSVQDSVTNTTKTLNDTFGSLQKTGAVMAGVGTAITGACLGTVKSTFATQNALGELASLGVSDLEAVESAAKSFSDTWAGTTKADFITASYDIKSGISSLTDEGVAKFTELAALTGKATKSTTEEMGSLFATGYGIYKGFYNDLSDIEFGEMFSAGIATAVKNYKTSGSQMAASISALGATATNNNVPLEEQLAILGQLQTTMSGSEAATKYKAFLNQAASAGEKLGLTFVDANNQLLSTPEILDTLKSKYGDTIDAVEKQELKTAFGTDEAVAMIDLLYNNVDTLTTGVEDLASSMKNGTSVTQDMANAINNTPEQKFEVLKQQIHNNVEELGKNLLPTINETMDSVSGVISKGSEWINNNQKLISTVMNVGLKLGIVLVVLGSLLGVIGTVGKMILSAKTAITILKTAWTALSAVFAGTPIGWIVIAVVGLVAAFAILWNKSEAFRNFWIGLFNQIKGAVLSAWESLKPALQTLGDNLIGLYEASKPILKIIGAIAGAIATLAVGQIVGYIQGIIAALTPLANALSSLTSFVSNVINMIGALFKGDFSGAVDYAKDAVDDLKNFFINGFDAILSFVGGFASGFLDTISGALGAVGIDASGKISAVKDTIRNGLESVKGFFGNIMGAAADTAKSKLDNIKAAYESHGEGIKGVTAAALEGVKGYYTSGLTFVDNLTGGKLSSIKDKVTEKMSGVASAVSEKISNVKDATRNGLESVKGFFGNIMGAAADTARSKLDNIKSAYESHGGGIKGVTAAALEGVKGYYTSGLTFVDNLTGGKLSSIKDKVTEKMSGVASAVSEKMETAKVYASTHLSAMKSSYEIHGGGIKGIVAATMTGVRNNYSTAYSAIDNLTGGKLSSIKEKFTGKMNEAKSAVTSTLDNIRNAFSEKMEAARSIVTGVISKIKAAFNFSWKLPDLKVPHISVTGGVAPYGIAGKGSLPNFDIKWNAEGGIMTQPTIFGASGGKLLGGGEAGDEAILPLSKLWDKLHKFIRGEMDEGDGRERPIVGSVMQALTKKETKTLEKKESETLVTDNTNEYRTDSKGTIIQKLEIKVDISKLQDLPLLYKLIDELKDAQNSTDEPATI